MTLLLHLFDVIKPVKKKKPISKKARFHTIEINSLKKVMKVNLSNCVHRRIKNTVFFNLAVRYYFRNIFLYKFRGLNKTINDEKSLNFKTLGSLEQKFFFFFFIVLKLTKINAADFKTQPILFTFLENSENRMKKSLFRIE